MGMSVVCEYLKYLFEIFENTAQENTAANPQQYETVITMPKTHEMQSKIVKSDKNDEEPNKAGCGRIGKFIAKIINGFLFFWLLLHVHISFIIWIIWYHYFYESRSIRISTYGFMSVITISTAFIICYFGFISSGLYHEFQSWMIGYIGWMTIISLQTFVEQIYMDHNDYILQQINFLRMRILGIKLKKSKVFTTEYETAWVKPVASLLPATIIGFIANFFLQERFQLNCGKYIDELESDICYSDGRACCVIISSYDFDNSFDFMGKLASNILATFGVIRVIAWFMVLENEELRQIADKTRK